MYVYICTHVLWNEIEPIKLRGLKIIKGLSFNPCTRCCVTEDSSYADFKQSSQETRLRWKTYSRNYWKLNVTKEEEAQCVGYT